MTQAAVTLIDLTDRPGWEAATAASGLPMHSWAYARGLVHAGITPQLAQVRTDGAEMLLAFHTRPFQDQTDITTLPGLAGAHIQGDPTASLQVWHDYARTQGWICGYLQLSAFSPAPDTAAAHNALYVFDTAKWDPATALSRNTRKSLAAGDRAGATLVQDTQAIGAVFGELHTQAMARAGGAALFGAETLTQWFGAEHALAFGAKVAGQIEAAQLGWVMGKHAELHLAGSSDAGRGLQGWLIAQAVAALRAQGVRYVNIGGYGVPGDGLDRMKQRFNIPAHPLRAVRQIYRADVFADLCRATGADPTAAYFPPYRA